MLEALGGNLVTAGKKSIDLIDAEGRAVQVKARALDQGVERIFAFSTFEFDLVIFIVFDASSYQIAWARSMAAHEAEAIARYRVPVGTLQFLRARPGGLEST